MDGLVRDGRGCWQGKIEYSLDHNDGAADREEGLLDTAWMGAWRLSLSCAACCWIVDASIRNGTVVLGGAD